VYMCEKSWQFVYICCVSTAERGGAFRSSSIFIPFFFSASPTTEIPPAAATARYISLIFRRFAFALGFEKAQSVYYYTR